MTSATVKAQPDAAPSPADPPAEPSDDGVVDHRSAWDDAEPATSAPPSTSPAPQPDPSSTTRPPPAPTDTTLSLEQEEIEANLRSANGIAIGGYVCLGLGAGTLVLVSAPFWIASGVAKGRASGTNIFIAEEELLARAERRIRVARISAAAGGGVLIIGGILVAAGLGWRASLRAQKRELAVVPLVGPTQGAQIQFRF